MSKNTNSTNDETSAPDLLGDSNGKPASKTGELQNDQYEKILFELQIELVLLQEWIQQSGNRLLVIFEGRDAAGKGGAIKRITERLNPRVCRTVALGKPTERERKQWYFQRYVEHLPTGGEIVLMDRSWYNRAGVERVMGFCTDAEYYEFLASCPEFERLLTQAGMFVVKYWFSISADEQERRFKKRLKDPTKRWKLSPMDLESRVYWNEYSHAKDIMMQHTDTSHAPWYVVEADNKQAARLNCIHHLLSLIPFEKNLPNPAPEQLPPRPSEQPMQRTPLTERKIVPQVY